MSNNKGSNALIQQLLKAEEEAEAIVRRAKENRVKLLNEAIAAANKDLEEYSKNEEKALMEQYSKDADGDDPHFAELEKRSEDLINEADTKFNELKESLVKKLIEATLDIKPRATPTFVQNLTS